MTRSWPLTPCACCCHRRPKAPHADRVGVFCQFEDGAQGQGRTADLPPFRCSNRCGSVLRYWTISSSKRVPRSRSTSELSRMLLMTSCTVAAVVTAPRSHQAVQGAQFAPREDQHQEYAELYGVTQPGGYDLAKPETRCAPHRVTSLTTSSIGPICDALLDSLVR